MFSLKNTNDEFEKIVLTSLEETHKEEQEIIIPVEYGGDTETT